MIEHDLYIYIYKTKDWSIERNRVWLGGSGLTRFDNPRSRPPLPRAKTDISGYVTTPRLFAGCIIQAPPSFRPCIIFPGLYARKID